MRPDFWKSDKEAAAAYWETAKEELGVDSLELDFTIEDTESAQNVAAFIQSEIETACPGLTINLKVMPKAQRLDDMENGNFELGLHRTGSLRAQRAGQAGPVHHRPQPQLRLLLLPPSMTSCTTHARGDRSRSRLNNCLDLKTWPAQRRGDPGLPHGRLPADRPSLSGYFHHLIGVSWDFMNVDIAE